MFSEKYLVFYYLKALKVSTFMKGPLFRYSSLTAKYFALRVNIVFVGFTDNFLVVT